MTFPIFPGKKTMGAGGGKHAIPLFPCFHQPENSQNTARAGAGAGLAEKGCMPGELLQDVSSVDRGAFGRSSVRRTISIVMHISGVIGI